MARALPGGVPRVPRVLAAQPVEPEVRRTEEAVPVVRWGVRGERGHLPALEQGVLQGAEGPAGRGSGEDLEGPARAGERDVQQPAILVPVAEGAVVQEEHVVQLEPLHAVHRAEVHALTQRPRAPLQPSPGASS